MPDRRSVKILAALTVAAVVLAAVQYKPFAFLPDDATDFVIGLAIGLGAGLVVSWLAVR